MEILKFKTNIKDQEAIAKVANLLDQNTDISKWNIDTEVEENILSISGEDIDPQKIENVLQEAGFEAELLRVVGIGGKDL